MKRLISRADLARLAGVSKPTITALCKRRFRDALDGDRIDASHPAVVAYLIAPHNPKGGRPKGSRKSRAGDASRAGPVPEPPEGGVPAESVAEAVERAAETVGDKLAPGFKADIDVDLLGHMTVREVAETLGTTRAHRDWLDALKRIEDIRGRRLENDRIEGDLISRDLVRTHVVALIDALHRRLLMDTSKTAARLVFELAKSGRPIEEAERALRSTIESQLKPMKAKAARALRDA